MYPSSLPGDPLLILIVVCLSDCPFSRPSVCHKPDLRTFLPHFNESLHADESMASYKSNSTLDQLSYALLKFA